MYLSNFFLLQNFNLSLIFLFSAKAVFNLSVLQLPDSIQRLMPFSTEL